MYLEDLRDSKYGVLCGKSDLWHFWSHPGEHRISNNTAVQVSLSPSYPKEFISLGKCETAAL